jgi:secondary thiamine-phosphate synthase enzyme
MYDLESDMRWIQKELTLRPRPRGVHLITEEVLDQLPEVREFSVGLMHLFLRHTSASLALNENTDPDVRGDLEAFLSRLVPDGSPYFRHRIEGPDDMPAHIKAVLIGPGIWIPIRNGRPHLGTWQGIYLCEHRHRAGARSVTATLFGATHREV